MSWWELESCELVQVTNQMVRGKRFMHLRYRDGHGDTRHWDDATNTWSGSRSVRSLPFATPLDDYVISGLEWNAANGGARLFVLHVAEGETLSVDMGLRLQALTDWIPLSDMQRGHDATLSLVIGMPETDARASGQWLTEYVGEGWGERLHGWTNQRGTGSVRYNIKHHWGYDLRQGNWLPESRHNVALKESGVGYDARQVQWGSVLHDDDGTYVMTYSAKPSKDGVHSITLATSSSPNGPWTKYEANPVVKPVDGTVYADLSHSTLVKDYLEPDAARRYKMICTAVDDRNSSRVALFSAPDRTGPWTFEGVLIDIDATESKASYRGAPVRQDGKWHLFYGSAFHGKNETRLASGARLEVGSIHKTGLTIFREGENSAEGFVTKVGGRIVTMASTAGFARDQVVVYINSDPDRPRASAQVSRRRLSVGAAGALGTVASLGALWARSRRKAGPATAVQAARVARRDFILLVGASGISIAGLVVGFPAILDALARRTSKAATDRTPAAEQYGLSRVRKVLNETQLELYHSIPGARGNGELRTINSGGQAPQRVLKVDNEWVWITTAFKVFASHETDRTHFETTALLRSPTLTGKPVVDWHATPIALMGRWNNRVSSENLRLVSEPFRE